MTVSFVKGASPTGVEQPAIRHANGPRSSVVSPANSARSRRNPGVGRWADNLPSTRCADISPHQPTRGDLSRET